MCGIAGIVSNVFDDSKIKCCLQNANNIQNHRGPDAKGIYVGELNGQRIGLAHQRLSIIDLSEVANQPMGDNGRNYIIYNGEVYNYIELRNELQRDGYTFISNSDTEVILAAIKHWGIEEALNRFNGMWALAYLDIERSKLYLARDRFGIKPLYYSINNQGLFFGSEIKTILAMTNTKYTLDYQIIGEYLEQSLAETSFNTFFRNIKKVPQGSIAEIQLGHKHITVSPKVYYELDKHLTLNSFAEKDLIVEVKELFFDAVNIRLRSDVPIGVLLSGGIDSSSIAAVVGSRDDIKFLSAVSDDKRFDESPFIDTVASYINKPVYKVNLDMEQDKVFSLLEDTCWHNDEPVGSFSNVAHYLLMKKAKDLGVTVILSGQGADELLCGYRKYLGFYITEMLRNGDYKNAMKYIIQFTQNGTVIKQFSLAEAKRYLPKKFQPRVPDIKGQALRDYKPRFLGIKENTNVRQRQVSDIYQYSVPILTHYEDRMSMAWSREVRVPFLDYRLVELLVGLPTNMKLKNGWTKYILRKAMEPYLPKSIIWRKDKQGFVNPQSEWLKHSLKPNVLRYFEEDSLIFKHDLVDRDQLLALYRRYCKQKPNQGQVWFKDIFNPLALEIWLRQNERYIA